MSVEASQQIEIIKAYSEKKIIEFNTRSGDYFGWKILEYNKDYRFNFQEYDYRIRYLQVIKGRKNDPKVIKILKLP